MNQSIILVAVFVAVLLVAFTISQIVASRLQVSRNIEKAHRPRGMTQEEIDKVLGSGNENLRYYLEVVQREGPDSLRMRLVQAGYFSRAAIRWFNLIRTLAAAATFLLIFLVLPTLMPSVGTTILFTLSIIMAVAVFILSSAVLERIGAKRMREFRKLFPDFMDLLLVCVDAGLSIDAALDRVTREFLVTTPDFGMQLSLVELEVRAGRPLHDALVNLSYRIRVEEARTLAVLFRQSQELGASVANTLRVFAREMRQMRLVRAEEKANALPIKMLFPMALFMFPVNLVIVLVPILLVIFKMFLMMAPR